MYCRDGMTQQEIADELECGVSTVSRWIRKHGLASKPWQDKETLQELFIKRGYSLGEVADELGCYRGTIRRWVQKHNLYKRPWHDPEVLRELFVEKDLSVEAVADELSCARRTVKEWVIKYDLPNDFTTYDDPVEFECYWCGKQMVRARWEMESDRQFCSTECANDWRTETFTGEGHPNWQGGVFPYGKGWTKRKREGVRERDGRECQHCGRSEEEHLEKFGTKHVVHHIVPARKVDDPEERNAKDNLITLCRGDCHHTWEQFAPLRPDTNAVSAD